MFNTFSHDNLLLSYLHLIYVQFQSRFMCKLINLRYPWTCSAVEKMILSKLVHLKRITNKCNCILTDYFHSMLEPTNPNIRNIPITLFLKWNLSLLREKCI